MTPPDRDTLSLRCPGCGAVVGLRDDGRLIAAMRPFVEEHRGCDLHGVDLEMRSAFTRTA